MVDDMVAFMVVYIEVYLVAHMGGEGDSGHAK